MDPISYTRELARMVLHRCGESDLSRQFPGAAVDLLSALLLHFKSTSTKFPSDWRSFDTELDALVKHGADLEALWLMNEFVEKTHRSVTKMRKALGAISDTDHGEKQLNLYIEDILDRQLQHSDQEAEAVMGMIFEVTSAAKES